MKNLFEKLKPEIRDVINNHFVENPTGSELLINELKSAYFINDLKYFAILDIQHFHFKAFGKAPIHAWDCLVDNYINL